MRRGYHRSSGTLSSSPRRIRRRGFRPSLSRLEDRTLLATMLWINPAGGVWDTASNWVNSANPSDQHVPTGSDNAVIDLPDITVTHDSGTDAVNSITSQDPIVLNGGTLTIASASTINSNLTVFFNSMTDTGATLGVNGTLAVNGLFTLGPNSTLTGSGTVDAYGGLNLSGYEVSIQGTTLNNHAAATWGAGGGNYDTLSAGAVLNNMTGATFTIVNSSGGELRGGLFNNAGSFTTSTAVGGDVDINSTFVNTGTVDVQGGELDLAGDGATSSTGSFSGAAGTLLSLYDEVLAPSSVLYSTGAVTLGLCTEAGTYSAAGGTVADSTTFTGPVLDLGSSLEVSNFGGGSVSFAPAMGGPATLTVGNLTLDPSAGSSATTTLTGTDNFVVDGLLTLSSTSQLSVSGTVDAYGGLLIRGQGTTTMRGTTLNNHAAAMLDTTAGPSVMLYQGATINNLAGATFVASGGQGGSLAAGDGSAVAFNNTGTFTCSVPPCYQVAITLPFVNTGSVVLDQGGLTLNGDGMTPSPGTITTAAGTYLDLQNMVLPPSSLVSSNGDVELDGVTEAGSYSSAGATITYGAAFTGQVLGLGSSLVVAQYGCSFAPSVGGPVPLTVCALTIGANSTLSGTDSFVANGLLTLNPGSHLSVSGSVDAHGGLALSDGPVYIQGTTLNNYGTATWELGPFAYVQLDDGAVIDNMAGATSQRSAPTTGELHRTWRQFRCRVRQCRHFHLVGSGRRQHLRAVRQHRLGCRAARLSQRAWFHGLGYGDGCSWRRSQRLVHRRLPPVPDHRLHWRHPHDNPGRDRHHRLGRRGWNPGRHRTIDG